VPVVAVQLVVSALYMLALHFVRGR